MVTGRRLLLADDSVTIQKVVELTFSDEGLEVIAVGDGQRALEMLEERMPDIVLADVLMPGISGYEICEHIKRSERFRHIPVLLLVGSFEPFDEEEARRVGADDYLTKPFQSIRQLIGKVGGLLSGKRASEEETTRKLTPPPEFQPQDRLADADFIARSTADTAPLPAHEKTPGREASFNDISMDDEMIEATPAETYGNVAQPVESVYARQTMQYSAADLKEAGISGTMQSESAAERPDQAHDEPFSPARTAEDEDVPATAGYQPPAEETRSHSFAASDDALLDLGEEEPPAAFSEADEFILDLQDDAPAPQAEARGSEQSFAETEPASFEAAPAPVEQVSDSAHPAQAYEFADDEVVGEEPRAEFAPVEAEATTEEVTAEMPFTDQQAFDMHSAPTERFPDNFQIQDAPAVSPVEEGAQASEAAPAVLSSSSTGQITLEQLSPEVIDAIARRAVEHLSERVVERIAWEVVPELAELLIKRRLEEERQ